jgi:hypothetical protein
VWSFVAVLALAALIPMLVLSWVAVWLYAWLT